MPRRTWRTLEGDINARSLAAQIRLAGLPAPELEHRFHAERRWRFDLAYPSLLFAVEVDGMVHRIKERFEADLEKHQAWFAAGWQVLRVSPRQVRSGAALGLVEAALSRRGILPASPRTRS